MRLAGRGETVLVTDRDRVVAELVPPRPGRAREVADSAVCEAVRAGWLTPAATPGGELPSRAPVAPLAEILAGLDSDRDDR